MAFTLPKLNLPQLSLGSRRLQMIAGGIIVVAAAGWFGWQYLMQEPPAPSAPPPAAAAKQAGPAKAAPPADSPAAQAKLIEDVLAASGLKQTLSQLPQQLSSRAGESGKQDAKASPAIVKAIETAVAEAFAGQGFQDRVSADLKKNFDRKRLQAVLKDFSAPGAKRMNEVGQVFPSRDELAAHARKLGATPPSSQRADLIKRIDAATKESDLAVDIASGSMRAFAQGVAGDAPQKVAAVEKIVDKQIAARSEGIRKDTVLRLDFAYKGASDAELDEYAKILETENAKWFFGTVYASLADELKSAWAQAGKRVGELLSKPAAPGAGTADPRARPAGAKAGADARSCLSLESNTAIMKCAEAYR
jgi:hypothetical protein